MATTSDLGRTGEELAARYLVQRGLVILDRNWRCPFGELDIVARDGDTLVFCEVKTRSALGYGPPAEAVTPSKAARLRRLAGRWLAVNASRAKHIRIDVVGVVITSGQPPTIEHLRAVV